MSRPRPSASIAALVAAALAAGCLAPMRAPRPAAPLRLSEVADRGDPSRRASMRLLLEGLDHDAEAQPRPAMGLYERALQVDPTNPYAFLAVARHHVDGVSPQRAFAFLDKAEALLRTQELSSPGVEAHLLGLRGAALRATGQGTEAAVLLEQARRLAPVTWADGRLAAGELR